MKTRHRVSLALCTLFLLTSAACRSNDASTAEDGAPAFIDPLVLSQSQCSGLKPPAVKPTAAQMADADQRFTFGAPYALPDRLVEQFHVEISTGNPAAQSWFDVGLAHMANFNHDEAIAAFRKAQDLDPTCAMCFWGEGLAFGSNINAPFEAPRGLAGRVAAERALERAEDISPRETALINALSTRYHLAEDGTVTEAAMAYAEAMETVAEEFPEDPFILSLAAEANMDTQPWDYWQANARVPKGRTDKTVDMLEHALEIDPDYAPAIHLYIHTTEASVDPFRAEAYADSLAGQSLGVGHLVHMPSHIYLRLGRWQKSHTANIAAIAADERYIAESENAGFYGAVYYPHNVHFVLANAQLAGNADTAMTMAGKLASLVEIDPAAPAPLAEHIAASQIFSAVQFGEDDAVLAFEEPAAPHLYMRAAWHYARGTVHARQGDMALAEAELKALARMSVDEDLEAYAAYGAPIEAVLDVARGTLKGRIAHANGDLDAAIVHLDAAADMADSLPYFEPTWWYYPTRQTLGAYLLADGQADRAEREFYRTLIKSPNSAYALHGLAEAYAAKGDRPSEVHARHLFNEAWMGDANERPDLGAF